VNRIAVRPGVAVMDHSRPHRAAGLVPAPQRHRQAVLDERDVLDRRGRPAHDRPGVQVDGQGDVDETGPRGHVGEIGDPSVVGPRRRELPVEQVARASGVGAAGHGRARRAAADQPGHAQLGHQPVHGVRGHRRPALGGHRPVEPGGHLAPPVADLRRRPARWPRGAQGQQPVADLRVAQRPGGRGSGAPGPVGAWGDLQAHPGQDSADRLDPTPGGVLLIDETEDQRARGSSSRTKKTVAALRISLASRRSADLGLEPADLLQLLRRRAGPVTGVDLGLQDPLPQRLRTDAQLGPERLRAGRTASGTPRAGPSPSAAPAPAARPGTSSLA
jgi:hypothetical protein